MYSVRKLSDGRYNVGAVRVHFASGTNGKPLLYYLDPKGLNGLGKQVARRSALGQRVLLSLALHVWT